MKVLGVIPARYGSSRFPGKPLIDIGGMSMIQRVYTQCKKAEALSGVYVATDDQRIFDHVIGFGGKAVMTSADHQTGTERCAEVIDLIEESTDVTINIQGDEPFIDPQQINDLARCFTDNQIQIASMVKPEDDINKLENPNFVKAIRGSDGYAVYFSRQIIPFFRGINISQWTQHHQYYKHIGIYAYRSEVLKNLVKLKKSPLEIAESLEQLRWMENSYRVYLQPTTLESISIDTPEDLEVAIDYLSHQK